MRLPLADAHTKTRGLDQHIDLTDPHATIPDATTVSPHNWAAVVADGEEVGEEVVVEDTALVEEVTKMMGKMMTRRVAIALMARVTPTTMGETPGIDPSRCHGPPGVIPVTWWDHPHSDTKSGRP